MSATLQQLQSWLFERVTRAVPDSVGDAELGRRLVSGSSSAAERIEVYRHGYFARLVECLEDDYPALAHALGAERFEALCRDFISFHPPQSVSLNAYGAPFAEYCGRRPETWSAFAAELAQLEWAVVEAIHAEEGERLDIEALGRLSPQQWSVLRLVPSPTLRLLFSAYPVADQYQAFKDGAAAALGTGASGAAPLLPVQGASALVVCRRGDEVWRIPLGVSLGELLQRLISGTPLLEALERFGSGTAALAPEELQHAFRDWVACGLFSGVA